MEEILRRAESERPFFGKRGGITFSGGEPTAQAKALVPVVRELKARGFHVCIDSNGGVWNKDVEELLGLADLTLLDVKEFNSERHRRITGHGNEQTLRTADWLAGHGKPFWLRYVLVPGLSDFEEDIRALGEHFRTRPAPAGAGAGGTQPRFAGIIQRVELLPYHTLGKHKYEALGQKYALEDTPLNTPAQLDRAVSILEEYFDCVVKN